MTLQAEGTTAGRDRAQARRAAVASGIGTTIEFYDFFIYGIAAALVFPTVFFPALGATAGTVAAFATYAVAFVARPVGAAVFGHFGDRIGRKRTLIWTLLLVGVSTVLIGFLPGSATIGVAAPVILVVLRFVQGFAVGGEWAGAALLAAEHAEPRKRGFYGTFTQVGAAFAFGLATLTFLITNLTLGDTNEAFLSYGWRIPFIASIVLVAFGLYARLRITETPVFRTMQDAGTRPRTVPFLEVVRRQPRELLLLGGAVTMAFAFFYMGTSYLTSYGTNPAGPALSRSTVLAVGVGAAVVFGAVIVVAGRLSDRYGRRTVMTASSVLGLVWGVALFPVLDTGPVGFAVGMTVTLVIFAIGYGPVAAFAAEVFPARYRYTGAGISYNLAGVFGGALPPIVAAPLAAAYGGIAIGVMLSLIALVSLLCTRALREDPTAFDQP